MLSREIRRSSDGFITCFAHRQTMNGEAAISSMGIFGKISAHAPENSRGQGGGIFLIRMLRAVSRSCAENLTKRNEDLVEQI
jgi:hypothetical protein